MNRNKYRALCGILFLTAFATFASRESTRSIAQAATSRSGSFSSDHTTKLRLIEGYRRLPLSFEVNAGQTNSHVRFLSRGSGHTLFLTGSEAVLALHRTMPNARSQKGKAATRVPDDILRMRLVGVNPSVQVTGLDELPGKSNYFIGNDPKKWRTNLASYAKVKYEGIYPGVDLVYYGNQQQLEYDFVVAPGADPKTITLDVGAGLAPSRGRQLQRAPLWIDGNGDLVVRTGGRDVRFQKPVVYQEGSKGAKQYIDGCFDLRGRSKVSFEVAAYDPNKELVIDPVLSYSTYIGGSGDDAATAVAVDASGNAYVTGQTNSVNFPTASPFQAANAGGYDAFVTKLNATGSSLLFSSYLGGSGDDIGEGVAVDRSGNAYITGATNSADFPTVNPYQATYGGGNQDAFFAELNSTGSFVLYSTYLGGNAFDVGEGIAVDSSGNAYLTGVEESSSSFPVTLGAFQTTCGGFANFQGNAFVAKFDPTKSGNTSLIYSTCLGGSGGDSGHAIAVDASGNAYITGLTFSTDFPTTSPFQAANAGGGDAFVTKLNATGSALVYSTYLGGSASDQGFGIALDSSGNAYVTGFTQSTNFPTASSFQAAEAGGQDAFVAKLNPAGSALLYSTYLGGSGDDFGHAIAVDSSGNAYITGYTFSTNFPTASPLQAANAGPPDAFIAELNTTGATLLFSTYLGGSGTNESGMGIAVDTFGSAYIAGYTDSTNFPTASGAFQTTFGGGSRDAFVAKFGPSYSALVQPPINADGSSVFNAKRGVVPVKFTLTLDGASTCSLPPATISLTRTAGATPGSVDESVYLLSSDSGSNFRISDCQYVYNLATGSLGTGTYVVNITINGFVVGSATFGLQ